MTRCSERTRGEERVWVAGGGELYAHSLPKATEMHLTHVSVTLEGDAFFPEFDQAQWSVASAVPVASDKHNEHRSTYVRYKRL